MIKKLLIYVICLFLILILIILYKAYAHQPSFKEVSNTEKIILDDSKSIQNLSKSITYKTISHPDYEK
jgi:cell division protein FtsL